MTVHTYTNSFELTVKSELLCNYIFLVTTHRKLWSYVTEGGQSGTLLSDLFYR